MLACGTEWTASQKKRFTKCFTKRSLRKHHTRPALTWTAGSTFIRSHQHYLGNHTYEWPPVGFEPSISVVKLFHLITSVPGSRSRVCTIGLSWRMGRFSMVGGAYTQANYVHTCTTYSRHNTSRFTGLNIPLIKVVSIGGTFWLLVSCIRKHHTRPALVFIHQYGCLGPTDET